MDLDRGTDDESDAGDEPGTAARAAEARVGTDEPGAGAAAAESEPGSGAAPGGAAGAAVASGVGPVAGDSARDGSGAVALPAGVEDPAVEASEAVVGRSDADARVEGGVRDIGGGIAGGLSWAKVAVLGVALAFLGFAVGFVVTRERAPGADSADIGFLQDMITHHDQAVRVAVLTLAYGEDPTVRSYAVDVLASQQYEVGVMSEMLDEWGYSPADRPDEAMAWMGMAGPAEAMPGMLTDDQLDEMRDARGGEIDRLFLLRMAGHHRGGVHMAQEGAALAGDGDVVDLASRMERNQASEINEYRVTADALGLDLDIAPADVPGAD